MGFSAAHYIAAGDAILGKAAFAVALPTSFVCRAYDGDPGYNGLGATEVSGGGYVEEAVPLASIDAGAGSGPVTWALNANIEFAQATGSWLAGSPVTHFALWDVGGGGLFRMRGTITTPVGGKIIDNLDTLIIQAGTLLTLS